MKILISVVVSVLMLQGCSEGSEIPTLAETGPDASTGNPPPRTPEEDPQDTDPYRYPCDRVETVLVTVDSGTYRFEVPLPCDPLWKLKDHGDPPPFRGK